MKMEDTAALKPGEPAAVSPDVVSKQGEVDDLLSSLGF